MRKLWFVLLSLTFCTSFGQSFDAELERLANGLATNINKTTKKKVAVWGFVTESNERTALGNYITEDFSVYLTNFGSNFDVIDRNHLDAILREHKLNSEGYIDEATAKELGKIIAVDAIITGTYTVLNDVVKVRAKVLDTETALQFAANMGNLPINENIASYLGISVGSGNAANKGFNVPLNSRETYNNPDTVDSMCQEESFGDLCFYNSLKEKIVVRISHFKYLDPKAKTRQYDTVFLDPGETKCVYKIYSRPIDYYVATWDVFQKEFEGYDTRLNTPSNVKYLKDKGQVNIETCKSKTFTIK